VIKGPEAAAVGRQPKPPGAHLVLVGAQIQPAGRAQVARDRVEPRRPDLVAGGPGLEGPVRKQVAAARQLTKSPARGLRGHTEHRLGVAGEDQALLGRESEQLEIPFGEADALHASS